MNIERAIREIIFTFKLVVGVLLGFLIIGGIVFGISSCNEYERKSVYPYVLVYEDGGGATKIKNIGKKFVEYYRDGNNIVLVFEEVSE